jgi:hypothetical protein
MAHGVGGQEKNRKDTADLVELWSSRIIHAETKYRQLDKRDRHIEKMVLYTREEDKNAKGEKVSINELRRAQKTYKTQFSEIALNGFVSPQRPDDLTKKQAAAIERSLTHYGKEKGLKRTIRGMIDTGTRRRWAWVKVGYETGRDNDRLAKGLFTEHMELLEEVNSEYVDNLDKAKEFRRFYSEFDPETVDHESVIRHGLDYTKQGPWAELLPEESVYVDPHARWVHERDWIIHRLELSPEEAADAPYRVPEHLIPHQDPKMVDTMDGTADVESYDPDWERVIVYECWDSRARTFCRIMKGERDMITPVTKAYWKTTELSDPFIDWIPEHGANSWEHPHIFESAVNLIDAKNHIISAWAGMSVSNPGGNLVVDASVFGDKEQNWLAEEGVKKILPVKLGGGKTVRDIVSEIQGFSISGSAAAFLDRLDAEIQRETGMSYDRMGGGGSDRKTATQSNIEEAAHSEKFMSLRAEVGGVVTRIFKAWAQFLQEFMSPDEAMVLLGDEIGQYWPDWSDEEIRSQFRFAVGQDAVMGRGKAVERAQHQDFTSWLAGFAQAIAGIYIPDPIQARANSYGVQMMVNQAKKVAGSLWGVEEDSDTMMVLDGIIERCRMVQQIGEQMEQVILQQQQQQMMGPPPEELPPQGPPDLQALPGPEQMETGPNLAMSPTDQISPEEWEAMDPEERLLYAESLGL